MALRDYRLCDACEEKVFYDAELDYRFPTRDDPIEPDERAKVCGLGGSYRLQYLGDWAVLCEQCAKTHRTAILPINAPEPSGETMAQREEVCAAWADLPPQLTAHPAMKRLYRALGGIRRADEAGVTVSPAQRIVDVYAANLAGELEYASWRPVDVRACKPTDIDCLMPGWCDAHSKCARREKNASGVMGTSNDQRKEG